jgi:ubiquitin carboxyl-terminal hydrolase 7
VQAGDDQSMVIDNLDQENEKQQDVTLISPQQSIDSESVDEKDQIIMADNCSCASNHLPIRNL